MTDPIHIELLTGAGAGRSASFDQSPVKFGRDADNDLILAEPAVSRHHGELRYEDDRWVLVNLSANGTRVGRKKVTSKPHVLRPGEAVSVGETPLFKVGVPAAADDPENAASAGAAGSGSPDSGDQPKRINKVYVFIGVWIVLLLGLVVFFSTLSPEGATNGTSKIRVFTEAEIAADVREPHPPVPYDDQRYREALSEANRLATLARNDPTKYYPALVEYKKALAYGKLDRFEDPETLLRYNTIEQSLIDEVTDLYQGGVRSMSQPSDAIKQFERLKRIYPKRPSQPPAPDNLIKNVIEHNRAAIRAAD